MFKDIRSMFTSSHKEIYRFKMRLSETNTQRKKTTVTQIQTLSEVRKR